MEQIRAPRKKRVGRTRCAGGFCCVGRRRGLDTEAAKDTEIAEEH